MYRRPYLESSVFIAYIKGEIVDGDDRKAIVDSVLASAQNGDFPIYTSALTIVEVYKTKKSSPLTQVENEDLRPYFREAYIRLIEVDREVAERSNELCANSAATSGARLLRPNDGVHIASAERAECEVLLTYDDDLLKQRHPTMRIEKPKSPVMIPRQRALESGIPVQEPLALDEPEDF